MLFNSFLFILCFPIAAAVYALLRLYAGRVSSQVWLLAMSLAFYSFGKLHELPYLAGSILFNWAVARKIAGPDETRPRRKRWLVFALTANIVYLSLFKYINLFLRTLAPVLHLHFALPNWGFPLGISFFTLMQVMYLVDCYEQLIPASSLFDHATFVAFFPYVIAGPLSRARSIVPQLRAVDGPPAMENVARGFALFTIGLCKKAVFADALVRVADVGFADPLHVSSLEAWISVVAYSLQIYFDFSGYTDMAVGVAKMLGFTIPINFNVPYISKSIIEFWQRWHISLSNFITTYLYTPILRSFGGRATLAKSAVATILAMTISGLWHGPSWTYVVWGLCHGAALAINQYWRKKLKIRLPRALGWLLTFFFVVLAEIFFRAPSLAIAFQLFSRLLPLHGLRAAFDTSNFVVSVEALAYMLPALASIPFAFFGPASQDYVETLKPSMRYSVLYASLFVVGLLLLNSVVAKEFIYFGF